MDIKKSKDNMPIWDSKKNNGMKNNDLKSALENNKNDLVSNQGNSGIKNVKMSRPISKVEEEYLIRSERPYRDEENPMYDDVDETWGAPDRF